VKAGVSAETRWIASIGRKHLKFLLVQGYRKTWEEGLSWAYPYKRHQISLGFVCFRLPVRHAGTFYGTNIL